MTGCDAGRGRRGLSASALPWGLRHLMVGAAHPPRGPGGLRFPCRSKAQACSHPVNALGQRWYVCVALYMRDCLAPICANSKKVLALVPALPVMALMMLLVIALVLDAGRC